MRDVLGPWSGGPDTDTDGPSTADPGDPRDSDDTGPWQISGTALGLDGLPSSDGPDLLFTADALRTIADRLPRDTAENWMRTDPDKGKIVVDHDPEQVVDDITTARFNPAERTVEFEARLSDRGLALAVERGEREVSIKLELAARETLETGDDGRKLVHADDVSHVGHLAVVRLGRAPANSVSLGPLDSIDTASSVTDTDAASGAANGAANADIRRSY